MVLDFGRVINLPVTCRSAIDLACTQGGITARWAEGEMELPQGETALGPVVGLGLMWCYCHSVAVRTQALPYSRAAGPVTLSPRQPERKEVSRNPRNPASLLLSGLARV
jgi:hypothetical protein